MTVVSKKKKWTNENYCAAINLPNCRQCWPLLAIFLGPTLPQKHGLRSCSALLKQRNIILRLSGRIHLRRRIGAFARSVSEIFCWSLSWDRYISVQNKGVVLSKAEICRCCRAQGQKVGCRTGLPHYASGLQLSLETFAKI